MRFVSLFAGVGGFDLGLEAAGWQCVAQVEWDERCQQVLRRHWPDVPKWGNVSTVRGDELPPADVITFGSPCQDLSVAGKRLGFVDGGRSNLFYEAIRIIKEMRDATDGALPRFAIWENVVGALSSNQGDDFAAVLDSLAEVGAVDIGWRVMDARWFGVAQRRRRVFVVADFAGRCAGAIHAEPESVRWDSAPCPPPGSSVAAGVGGGAARGIVGSLTLEGVNDNQAQAGHLVVSEIVGSLQSRMHKGANAEGAADGHLVVSSLTQGLGSGGPDAAHALAGGWAGSAQTTELAAPLLVPAKGGQRTTDIDGATWVVSCE